MKTLAEKIAVMQAALEGKKIRYRSLSTAGTWVVAKESVNFTWNWEFTDYEVVPEPRVIYVNEYSRGLSQNQHASLEEAKRIVSGCNDFLRTVKFVEVIE